MRQVTSKRRSPLNRVVPDDAIADDRRTGRDGKVGNLLEELRLLVLDTKRDNHDSITLAQILQEVNGSLLSCVRISIVLG
jgi:hypothetical protein